jgi:catechol 2,3-dioxygenase-like lactoylglutathione lyase family enzyme
VNTNVLGVHHVAISAADLAVTKEFYGSILGLEELPRPDFPIRGVWYSLGAQELHIGIVPATQTGRRFDHFAISVHPDRYHAYIDKIRRNGGEVGEPQRGPDGLYRAFIHDPSGNEIEITDAHVVV